MKYCFGVDIGGTTVKMGIFEEEGKNIDKWEIPTHTEDEGVRILPDIAASIKVKMEEHGIAKEDIIGVGVGVPAPVTAEGVVNGTANLGWKYKEVTKELQNEVNPNIIMFNKKKAQIKGIVKKKNIISKMEVNITEEGKH